jgi:autotransporter-associated beta strand protein
LLDGSKNGTLSGSSTYPGGVTVLSSPWSSVTATIPTATTLSAYRIDVSSSGAFPIDQLDQQVISQVTSLGTAGSLITSPANTGLGNSGYGTIDGGTALTETDGDGIPDIWKNAVGLPLNSNQAMTIAANGYANIENYLNWLAGPHAFVQTNATAIDLWPYTLGFTNTSPAYTFFNLTNCTVTLTNSHYAFFQPTPGFTGLAGFNFVVTGNDGSTMTNTMGVLVSVMYNPKNLVWRGDGINNIWDLTNTADWLFNDSALVTFNSSDNVTFDDTGSASPAINITTTVSPGSVVVNANQNYSFGGSGGIAGAGSFTKSGSGTLTLNEANTYTGGTVVNGGSVVFGSGAAIPASGTLTLNSTSIVTVASANSLPNVLVDGANSITGNGGSGTGIATLNDAGTLTLFVSGGSNVFDLTGTMTGAGNLILGSPNMGLRFNGTGGDASAIFNFGTGTSSASVRNSATAIALGGLAGGSGTGLYGASANANTVTFTIGGANANTEFDGTIQNGTHSGAATAITKVGTGTLTLGGNSGHTGTTTVSGGALVLMGNFSGSPVTVAGGDTLAGTGFFGGGVTIQSGGNLLPGLGIGSVGTLTVSNGLTLATPTLYFDLSSSPTGSNDEIVMQGGTLAMSGVQTYNFNLVNNALGAGYYSLIEGATGLTAWSGVTDNLPTGTRQAIAVIRPAAGSNPSYVRLAVTGSAASLVWQGTNGSAWDLSTTTNWLNGSTADEFYNLDLVRFDDTSTNGDVSITGTVQPATVLVTNNSLAYTIGGGALGGIASLTKNGSGTLILNSSNSFSGGTFVNGGTLQLVSSGYAAGTGPIFLNGGSLYLNGVGTGTTISSAGTNTISTYGQPYATFNLQGSGVLNFTVGGGGVFSPSGDWSGFSGTLNLSGNWVRELNTSAFGSSNAVWNFGAACGLYNKYGGATISLGALFGGSASVLGGATTSYATLTTFVVGGVNTNSVFNGTINDGSAAGTALVFNGPGSLALTGNSPFSGGTTVNAGTLLVNNTAGSGTGSGTVSINPGATLGGTGTIAGQVSLAATATLAPGGSSPGTLTIGNDLGLNNASVLQFQLGTNSDQIAVTGDLTLGGTLNISNAGGFGPGTYTLFTYGGALGVGTLTIGTTPASYTYMIDTSIQGQVNLIVLLPQFGNVHPTANSVVLTGTGGTPGATYYLLTSTNLATPLTNWTRLLTNQFDNNGNFNFTNPRGTNTQTFYLLQLQ